MDEEDFDAMPSPGSIFTESDDSEFGEEEEHSVKTEVGIAEDDQLEEKENDTEAEEFTPEEEKIEVTVEEDTTEEEEDVQEREAISEEKDDEEEYVNLSQEFTDSDDEDFVDVCAEIEKQIVPRASVVHSIKAIQNSFVLVVLKVYPSYSVCLYW